MKTTIAIEIQKILDEDLLSIEELAAKTGLTTPGLKKILSGQSTNVQRSTLRKIAEGTGRSVRIEGDQITFSRELPSTDNVPPLDGYKTYRMPSENYIREVPHYEVKAGAGLGQASYSENIVSYTKIFPGVHPSVRFTVRARGDSMQLAGINDGDLLFVAPVSDARTLKNGAIVIATDDNGDILVKIFQREGDKIMLFSASPKYRPIIKNVEEVRIIGQVIHSSHLNTFAV
jgi:SOS-response transcriptional repressor LexA